MACKTKMKREETKKKVMTSTCKENQLSEKSLENLEKLRPIVGELVSDHIKERLMGLSECMQADLIWRVLHYLYRDEIMCTGNIDVDIKLAEIVEKLPYLSVIALRLSENGKRNSESPECDNWPDGS